MGRPVATDAHPKHAIALGAAIARAAAAGSATTAQLADATSVVATPEEPVVSRTVAIGAAGWQPDPTGQHEYRYHDGRAWTDNVSDGGVTSTDPMTADQTAAAAGAPGPEPPSPRPGRDRRSRLPVVVAAIAAVAVIAGFFALRGNGGGNGGDGTGETRVHVDAGRATVHHVKVAAGNALLVKAIPDGNFDVTLGMAADFTTIEKYRTAFGFNARFSQGAIDTASDSNFTDTDPSGVKGGIFFVVNNDTAGKPEALVLPAPFAVEVDIVVSGQGGVEGDVTLQSQTRTFNAPVSAKDQGGYYMQLLTRAYRDFTNGVVDISAAKDFVAASDFTADSDFRFLSDGFTVFSESS